MTVKLFAALVSNLRESSATIWSRIAFCYQGQTHAKRQPERIRTIFDFLNVQLTLLKKVSGLMSPGACRFTVEYVSKCNPVNSHHTGLAACCFWVG